MKKFAWLFLLLGLQTSCADGKKKKLVQNAPLISVTYTDGTGRSMTLPHPPKSVISMAPNITEMVFALDAQDKLAACSQACDYPADAQTFPKIVTYPQVDREQIKATKADLILTTDEIFSPQDIQSLEELGTPVFLQQYRSLENIYTNIRMLGGLLDREEKGNAMADSMAALESRITQVTKEEIQYRTMILISIDPLIAVGGSGYLNEMIGKAGGLNVFSELPDAYATITVESFLAAQPEFLVLPSATEKVYADLINLYPMMINTPADKNKQVFIIDPDLLYRPGPRILEGLLQLTNIIHSPLTPDQFLQAADSLE